MFTNALEDALFEVRRHWKARVLIPLLIVIVFIVTGCVAGAIAWAVQSQSQPASQNSKDIPLGSYAAGNIQVLDCIYRGSAACSDYEKSKNWLIGASASSFTYPAVPGDANAPGTDVGGGNRKVIDFQALTDTQWHSLAAGATLSGKANPGTVTEKNVSTDSVQIETASANASFVLPGGEKGVLSFTVNGSGVVLSSITYPGGPQ